MTGRWSALLRHQIRVLDAVAALAVTTDEAVVAYLAQLGETCDRTTLVRWRAGERQAPLGLLPVLLLHLGADGAAELLTVLGRPLGLTVVRETAEPVERLDLAAASVAQDAARLCALLVGLSRQKHLRTDDRDQALALLDGLGGGLAALRAGLLGKGGR